MKKFGLVVVSVIGLMAIVRDANAVVYVNDEMPSCGWNTSESMSGTLPHQLCVVGTASGRNFLCELAPAHGQVPDTIETTELIWDGTCRHGLGAGAKLIPYWFFSLTNNPDIMAFNNDDAEGCNCDCPMDSDPGVGTGNAIPVEAGAQRPAFFGNGSGNTVDIYVEGAGGNDRVSGPQYAKNVFYFYGGYSQTWTDLYGMLVHPTGDTNSGDDWYSGTGDNGSFIRMGDGIDYYQDWGTVFVDADIIDMGVGSDIAWDEDCDFNGNMGWNVGNNDQTNCPAKVQGEEGSCGGNCGLSTACPYFTYFNP